MVHSLDSLTGDEREAALDIGQFVLDMVGIFEPTPVADLTSAIISVCRGDVAGAAISGLSVVPYAGDLAKLTKVQRYTQSIDSAIALARSSPRFAAVLQPLLARLLNALSRLPIRRLPPSVRDAIVRMDRTIRDFLPETMWALSRCDRLTEQLLKLVFGSARNIGLLQRQNLRLVVDFLDRHHYADGNLVEWAAKLKGLDLHAVDAVEIVHLNAGERVAMYVETSRPVNRQVGEWMVKAQGAVSAANLGISGAGRSRQLFRVKSGVEVLASKAAPVGDTWTAARSTSLPVVTTQGGLRSAGPELTSGGGSQYFLPRAWEFLERM